MEEEPGQKHGHTTAARYNFNPNACETTKGLKSVGRQLTELRLETGTDLEAGLFPGLLTRVAQRSGLHIHIRGARKCLVDPASVDFPDDLGLALPIHWFENCRFIEEFNGNSSERGAIWVNLEPLSLTLSLTVVYSVMAGGASDGGGSGGATARAAGGRYAERTRPRAGRCVWLGGGRLRYVASLAR